MAYAGDAYAVAPYAGKSQLGSGAITVSGSPWTSVAAWQDGSVVAAPIVLPGQPWSASAVWRDGAVVVTTPILVNGQAWASSATWSDGTLGTLVVAGSAWQAGATWLDGSSGSSIAVFGSPWAVLATMLDGQSVIPTVTRPGDGYAYTGSGLADYDPPVVVPSSSAQEVIQRVHQSLPTPTLINGRPS